jgi:hypothetical protein
LEKEVYREKLEVKVHCILQNIGIGEIQNINITVRDPIFDIRSGWVPGAEAHLEVSDNDSDVWFHSLDAIKTDRNGNAEFQDYGICIFFTK